MPSLQAITESFWCDWRPSAIASLFVAVFLCFRRSKVSGIWHIYVIMWLLLHITPLLYWAYIHILCWQHINASAYVLYSQTIKTLMVLQSIQWMEILHTLFKFFLQAVPEGSDFKFTAICRLEPTNLIFQICQLCGKYNTLMLCLAYTSPWFRENDDKIDAESYANNYLQFGYISLLLVWSLPHIIRYPFYLCKLWEITFMTSILGWVRYSAFLILYPIQYAAEMKCWYGLIQLLNANINDTTVNYEMNSSGSISLRGWAMFSFLITPFLGCFVYYKMIVTRRNYMKSLLKQKDNKND